MNRQAQAAVLFLTGAALLHAGFTDLYLRYVKAGLQPLLLLAGVVLIAAALATVWYEWRGRKQGEPQGAEKADGAALAGDGHGSADLDDDGHDHVHREPRISWLLVLPLLALILVAPPALGSYSAMRTGTALQKPYGYDNLPAAGPLRLSVVDYASRAVYQHGRTLDGRQIKVTGFVALDHAGTPYLVRMALNCCAADAQPVKIGLTGKVPPVLQPDKWLEVTGTYTTREVKDPVNNGPIPFLQVSSATPVATPADPYDETWNN
ncbi:TIGR03943 family putative permease subunit [Streptomyces pseudovenezuelae]|uniref:Repeat protein (TIGR03943 family) n=1 Tax=Streptomyces pseudovenezuelae TaxID=67350 RepID=A0ABT6LFZ7_9ACTN|nr:TIGR03943 family protein [Streptomyces pseudovenezuelae]MDH6214729.1 putative repeat protein (TIGR03943 family) [Streptomyces pseudovenezuelae]